MNKQKNIEFVQLKKTSSISLTGSYCSLNCNHCNGHYLKSMSKIKDMNSLINQGNNSFLISGGLMKDGKIPFRLFEDKLYTLKKLYGIKYNFHTGYIDTEDIPCLIKLADVISYDLIGDKDTMIDVYGHDFFDKNWDIFIELLKNGLNVKPHVTIGLNKGQISHEYKVVERLSFLESINDNLKNIDELIFLVFIPTKGTKYCNENPPTVDEVKAFLVYVNQKFPYKILTLGCMHPKGSYRVNLQEKLLGIVDKIVQPVNSVVKMAKDHNFNIKYSYECCAF
jgi:uncharacterized radical SAM superfamily protein